MILDRITNKEAEITRAYQVVTNCQKCNGTGLNPREELKIELAVPEDATMIEYEEMLPQIRADRKKEYIRRHSDENPKNSTYGLCKCYMQYEFIKGLILAEIPVKFSSLSYDDILPRDVNIDGYNEKKPLHDFIKLYVDKFSSLKKNSVGLNLIGKVGTGRSFVSQFIGAQIIRKRYSAHYIPFFALAKMFGAYDQADLIRDIFSVDLLIIDEIGNEHQSRRGFSGEISHMLQKRIQTKKPTIFCLNGILSEAELIEAYGGSFFSALDERNIGVKFSKRAISKTARNKYIGKILSEI